MQFGCTQEWIGSVTNKKADQVFRFLLGCIPFAIFLMPLNVFSSTFNLDVDDDREITALTDGLITIRYLFGFSGESLISGALGSEALRNSPEQVIDYLEENRTTLDVDVDGTTTALTDGLLVI